LPAIAEEEAQGWQDSDFEFIEIYNTGDLEIDLTDVRFTKGIDFDFVPGMVVASKDYVLVVRNKRAFQFRYGDGLPVAGEWDPDDRLDNGGENLRLSLGAGIPIVEFRYGDEQPWPEGADGDGFSLTLHDPAAAQPGDHQDPEAWRVSRFQGGSPGTDDGIVFSSWALASGLGGNADWNRDVDGDGLSNFMEYALATNPQASSVGRVPQINRQQQVEGGEQVGSYITFTFRRQIAAEDLNYSVEFSDNLDTWNVVSGFPYSITLHDDGTRTEVWRMPFEGNMVGNYFVRLRVEG